ncbi:MAG: glyoxalase/bleomycin resistance/dioxygenase family protein [Sulfitobacter sp.]|nr:glyoxalase/bleomycin resistance/dioxygenase family protein [Sulfitobacter sp.]
MPSAFNAIRAVDYTVIITRDMDAMRGFYESVLGFGLERRLSENWFEYRIGNTILTLSAPGLTKDDAPVPKGTAALQLAFRVPFEAVDACAGELTDKGIEILSPPTDRDFGHRTLFFRDPDGNLLEIYAEI